MSGSGNSDDDDTAPPAAAADTSTYEVGYGKPPVSGRIKPGEVRNPRGKAKRVRSFRSDIDEVLKMPVPMVLNGKTTTVTTRKASLLKLREKALKGDSRSLERFVTFANEQAVDEAVGSTKVLLGQDATILAQARARDAAALAANPPPPGTPAAAAAAAKGATDEEPMS